MVTVSLKTVWLNLAADPSDYVSLPTMSALSVNTEQPGEVRRMANGRLRLVKRAGQARSASVDIEGATRTEVEWLEDHVGDLVCVRDDRGRKFFGVYMSVDADEIRANDYAGVSLALVEVTHSEVA